MAKAWGGGGDGGGHKTMHGDDGVGFLSTRRPPINIGEIDNYMTA